MCEADIPVVLGIDDVHDHTHPNNHLKYLQGGDETGDFHDGPEAGDHESVVRIHDGVDEEIHNAKVKPARCPPLQSEPAEDKDGDVVEPVEEEHFSVANDKQRGVDEFGELGVHKERDEETRAPFHEIRKVIAHGRMETVRLNFVDKMRECDGRADDAENSKKGIPKDKSPLQIPRFWNPLSSRLDHVQIRTTGQDGKLQVLLGPSNPLIFIELLHVGIP